MSSDTRNHSFSLQPKASEIVNAVRDQKKSGFVSDAIVYYDSKQKLGELPSPGQVPHNEAKKMLPGGVLSRLFNHIRSFQL